MNPHVQQLLHAIQTYCVATGNKPSTACRKALGNSKVHQKLLDGGSITLATHERGMRWFEKNTPAHEGSA